MADDAGDDAERGKATLIQGREAPARAPARVDPVIGSEVSGYVVRGRLGAGGMGIVYEGEQPVIGKRVAIKVLRPEVAENPDVVQRLVAEARAVNAVGHRNIIDVFGFGELPDGRQCIVMEYLDGESLEAVLKAHAIEHRVMQVHDTLIILDEMLGALAAAHSAGVVHRDLKPSNIFLCRQRDGAQYVKLLDFGIAKLGVLGKPTPQTRASLLMGTPSYMAPEQARGGPVGPGMDLYAVGVIAYEMLTGRLPFTAETVVEMLLKHANEAPLPPSRFVMSIPDDLDELVLRLLAKKPEDRYPSADAVRDHVVRLRKELADPTAQRTEQVPSMVDVTGEEDTLVPPSRASLQRVRSSASLPVVPVETRAVPPPSAPASAAPEPKPAVVAPPVDDDASAIAPPSASKTPFIVIGVIAAVLLAVGAWVLWPAPPPPVVVEAQPTPPPVVAPPPPVEVKPPEPPPVGAPPPEPEPAVEATPPETPPAPVDVAPPPEDVKPPPPTKVASAKPVKQAASKPEKHSPQQALMARLKKLSSRLAAAEAKGADVTLYRRQVEKATEALQADTSREALERLESLVDRLEQSTDY